MIETITIDCSLEKMDIEMIHKFISNSYWAAGIPLSTMEKAMNNSLCFGAFMEDDKQIGFGRVITDYATYAYLADIFVLENFRGKGVGKLLVESIVSHHDLKELRRISLATGDAHSLYSKFGFTPLKSPDIFMEMHNENVYKK